MGRKSVRPMGRTVIIHRMIDGRFRWYVRDCKDRRARSINPTLASIFRHCTIDWRVTHYQFAGEEKLRKIPKKYFPAPYGRR